MRIATIGRGNIGGGLAGLWRTAGHEVEEFGRGGGDASGAEVALLAVPSGAIRDALAAVKLNEGVPVIDATNAFNGREEGFDSLAAQVKDATGGPVAKAFNANFAVLFDRLGDRDRRPGNLFVADDEAREVTERLIRDAGYEPVYAGGLESARALEDFLPVMVGVRQGGMGPFFYRFAPPEEL
jgi:8-hydroxy-5-deazaflavin:NADPH oxidoreductase